MHAYLCVAFNNREVTSLPSELKVVQISGAALIFSLKFICSSS